MLATAELKINLHEDLWFLYLQKCEKWNEMISQPIYSSFVISKWRQ